jgi:hypothetical protein
MAAKLKVNVWLNFMVMVASTVCILPYWDNSDGIVSEVVIWAYFRYNKEISWGKSEEDGEKCLSELLK